MKTHNKMCFPFQLFPPQPRPCSKQWNVSPVHWKHTNSSFLGCSAKLYLSSEQKLVLGNQIILLKLIKRTFEGLHVSYLRKFSPPPSLPHIWRQRAAEIFVQRGFHKHCSMQSYTSTPPKHNRGYQLLHQHRPLSSARVNVRIAMWPSGAARERVLRLVLRV